MCVVHVPTDCPLGEPFSFENERPTLDGNAAEYIHNGKIITVRKCF